MAFSMQAVQFIGVHTTRDGELKYTPGGTAILSFPVAYNYKRADGSEQAEFYEIQVFGKQAEAVAPMIRKGVVVAFFGHLQQDRWQDKDTGKTREKIRIIADRIRVERSADRGQAAPNYDEQQPAANGGGYGDF